MTPPRDVRAKACAASLLVAVFVFIGGCSQRAEVSAPPTIAGETRSFTFAAEDEGTVPAGWTVQQTGTGEGNVWQVVADESAPSGTGHVLAQVAESPRGMFNLCMLEQGRHADLKLSVAMKPVEGRVDQGGGLIWRCIDANNYYVCRFNPLEDNLRIYKVVAGKRQQMASVDVEPPTDPWHTLIVSMKDDLIVCTVGAAQVAARDDTFRDPGSVGLWTKADARTRFDKFTIKAPQVARDIPQQQAISTINDTSSLLKPTIAAGNGHRVLSRNSHETRDGAARGLAKINE